MKYENRKILIWEKGDYIRTPAGVGIVSEVSEEIHNGIFERQYAVIQHKFNSCNNTSNKPIEVDSDCLSSISEEEYEEEKDF